MTCIVGAVDEEKKCCYIGGDSVTTNTGAGQQYLNTIPKIFHVGEFLIGRAGTPRFAQLLSTGLILPRYRAQDDLVRYLVRDFAQAVKRCLRQVEEEDQEYNRMLVAYQARLFCLGKEGNIIENLGGYAAIGSGEDVALGVMHVTQQVGLPQRLTPPQRITAALEAAAYHGAYVRPPFLLKRSTPASTKSTTRGSLHLPLSRPRRD